ncbi:MAG: carbon storage regulator [Syntrophales bacterium]
MLILTRKEGETIQIGENVTVCIVEIRGNKVRVGIQAPAGTLILRDEKEPIEKMSINDACKK